MRLLAEVSLTVCDTHGRLLALYGGVRAGYSIASRGEIRGTVSVSSARDHYEKSAISTVRKSHHGIHRRRWLRCAGVRMVIYLTTGSTSRFGGNLAT